MRLEAVLEQHDAAVECRATARRSLKLAVRSQSPAAGELQIVIHNISRTGLLLEAPQGSLAVGDGLFLEVPEDGTVESKIVWESGRFFGSKFRSPVSQAAMSGALLQGQPRAAPSSAGDIGGDADAASGVTFFPELDLSVAVAIALLLWGAILVAAYLVFR
jgi:hypothetical protein